MNGQNVVEMVEKILKERGISKGAFYSATGISSTTFSQWRNGLYDPSKEAIRKIEEYLCINFTYNIDGNVADGTAEDVISDDQLKFAMFGDTNITDETFAELKEYAEYLKSRDKKRKG